MGKIEIENFKKYGIKKNLLQVYCSIKWQFNLKDYKQK